MTCQCPVDGCINIDGPGEKTKKKKSGIENWLPFYGDLDMFILIYLTGCIIILQKFLVINFFRFCKKENIQLCFQSEHFKSILELSLHLFKIFCCGNRNSFLFDTSLCHPQVVFLSPSSIY